MIEILNRVAIGELSPTEALLLISNNTPEFFIKSILDKIVKKTLDKYPNSVFYCIDNNIYFEMTINSDKQNYLYCRYHNFWEILQTKFMITELNIQLLIKQNFDNYTKIDTGISKPANIINFDGNPNNIENRYWWWIENYIENS